MGVGEWSFGQLLHGGPSEGGSQAASASCSLAVSVGSVSLSPVSLKWKPQDFREGLPYGACELMLGMLLLIMNSPYWSNQTKL